MISMEWYRMLKTHVIDPGEHLSEKTLNCWLDNLSQEELMAYYRGTFKYMSVVTKKFLEENKNQFYFFPKKEKI